MIVTTLGERKEIVQKFINDDLIKSFQKSINDFYGVIYKISNDRNDKVYIGKTKRFYGRAMDHVRAVLDEKYDERSSAYLYQSIREMGLEHFCMEIIDVAFSPEELSDKEVRYIVKYSSILPEFGYNTSVDRIKYIYSKESSNKRSLSHKGKLETANGRKRRSNPLICVNLDDHIAIYTDSSKLFGDVILNNTDRKIVLEAAKYCRRVKNYYVLYTDVMRINERYMSLQDKMKTNRKDSYMIASNYFRLYDILKRKDYDNFKNIFTLYHLRYDDSQTDRYSFERCEEIPC